MKKKIIDVFLMALLFTVTVGTVVSCKDYEEDNYADLKGNLTTISTDLEQRVKTLEEARNLLEKEVEDLRAELGSADDVTGNTIYARLATVESMLSVINDAIDDINNTLSAHGESIDKLNEKISELSGQCGGWANLAERVADNEKAIEYLKGLILNEDGSYAWSQVIEDAANSLTLAKVDSARIDALEDLLGDDFEDFKDAVAEGLKDAEGNWMSLTEVLDKYRDEIVGTYEGTLSDLSTEFMDSLNNCKERIAALETKTDELNDRLGLVESILNQYVSGVIIQGTKNPVYGTFSLPFGISSNVLAAYYGTLANDLRFPIDSTTVQKANYVYSKDGTGVALSDADLSMLGVSAGQIEVNKADHNYLVLDKEGNAGTLYLTINPVGVDHAGAQPTLENSQGTQSKVRLSGLEESDDLLSFGMGNLVTRNIDNGFYKTLATVDESAIDEIKPRVSYDDLKDIYTSVKDIVNNVVNNKSVKGIDIKPLLTTLYNVSTDLLDANAVKFSWTAKYENDGETIADKERSVMSKYELAATAIKPLSYNTWINADYDRLPGIGHVENIIGSIFDKVRDALPTFDIDDVDIEIGSIEISDITVDGVYTDVTIDFKGAVDGSGNPIPSETIRVDITDQVNDALNEAMGSIEGDLDDFVKNLQEQIDQINDLIAQLKDINDFGSSIDDIENQIYDYLHRGEDLALRFINNANKLLQPVMLVKTSDSFLIPSSSVNAPTRFSAATVPADGIALYPTSYTLEVLAPAYKKLVGVTNVYDKNGNNAQDNGGALRDVLQNVNSASGFGKVLDGDVRSAKLVGAQKGYIYEIAYSAVDYSGKVVAKKYYIELD